MLLKNDPTQLERDEIKPNESSAMRLIPSLIQSIDWTYNATHHYYALV